MAGELRGVSARFRRLSAEEERALVAQREALGPAAWRRSEARRTLIECHIPWANRVAGEWPDRRLGPDRFGLAYVELCVAVDTFEPGRGRIKTYSRRVIANRLWRASAAWSRVIDVPFEVQDHVRARRRDPDAAPRHRSMDRLVPRARRAMATASLDAGPGRETREWAERALAVAGPRPDPVAERVWEAMEELEREEPAFAQAVRLRFLEDGGGLSYAEVAGRLGVGRDAVEYRMERAYRKLRRILGTPDRRPR